MAHEPNEEGRVPERFEYFMVRLTRFAHQPDRLAGLVERLGTGEKRSFDTGEQLARLVGGGFALDPNTHPTASHPSSVQADRAGPSVEGGS